MMLEYIQLHKHFQRYFKVVPALTEDLVLEAQRIRHNVYCQELGWEKISADGYERDSYDKHSLHCLLKSVSRDEFIGCIRLVLPTERNGELQLPFQQTCKELLEPGHPDPIALSACEVAEVSRLAISADYRRRRHEQGKPVSFGSEEVVKQERRKFPYVPVALYIGMLEMASQNKIKDVYILTEPILAKHFSRLGGKLKPVGKGVEHRGLRVPYKMNIAEVLNGTRLVLKPLIRTIRRDVDKQLRSTK